MAYIGNPPFDVRSFGSTKFEFTATAGQTAFTGSDDNSKTLAFTDGHIEVYVNGVLMDNDDFSTSGGNTVTLTSAAAADDIITVTAIKTNVPNTDYVPASGGTFTGNVTVDGNLSIQGTTTTIDNATAQTVNLGDNDKIQLGDGNDLQIYHDGSNSRIEDINGANLILRSSADVRIDKYTGENMGVFNADGSVDLYYDNSKKFSTTSTGIDVTGTVFSDNMQIEASTSDRGLYWKRSSDNWTNAEIRVEYNADYGGTMVFGTSPTGTLTTSNTDRLKISNNGDISFYEDTGTTPKFFWDASAERLGLGTTSAAAILHLTKSSDTADIKLESSGGSGRIYTIQSRTDGNFSFVDSTAGVQRVTLDSSGDLGIGTANPESKLHVYASTNTSASTTGTTLLTLDNYVGVDLSQQKSFIDFRLYDDNDNETPQVRIGAEVGHNGDANDQNKEGSGAFIVYTNNADTSSGDAGSSLVEKFRIDYTGNAGLNVSAPASDVSGSAKVFQINHSNLPSLRLNHTGAASWEMISGGGGQLAWYDDGTERMKINSSGNLQLGQSTAGGRLAVNGMGWFHGADYQQLTLAPSTSSAYAGIRFSDHISGGSGASISTQRGYIRWTHSDGNTTTIAGRAGNASYVVGSTENINIMAFQYGMDDSGYGTNRGELYWSSGTNLTLYAGSDARLKENVASIPTGEAKQKVLAMNPVSYNFIDDTEEVKTNNLGFIAQELKDIVPEVVKGSPESDEMMSVNYAGLTPVLAAALKDALTEIENLKTRIEALENT